MLILRWVIQRNAWLSGSRMSYRGSSHRCIVPLNLTKILHRWWEEKDKFDYRNPHACSGCGHYIQMVKDVSYAIGCGTALCETVKGRSYQNAHIFVCNYGDGYNESPEPYAEGQACSDCPTGHPVCVQGLCDARWPTNEQARPSWRTGHHIVTCSPPQTGLIEIVTMIWRCIDLHMFDIVSMKL